MNISFPIIEAECTWFRALIILEWNAILNSRRFAWTHFLIITLRIKSRIQFLLHLLWLSISFWICSSYLGARFSLSHDIALGFGFTGWTRVVSTARKLFVFANEIFAMRYYTIAFFLVDFIAYKFSIWMLVLNWIRGFPLICSSWSSRYSSFDSSCSVFSYSLQKWLSSI
jgi:hypothetical protein